jgi:hypothetical protein
MFFVFNLNTYSQDEPINLCIFPADTFDVSSSDAYTVYEQLQKNFISDKRIVIHDPNRILSKIKEKNIESINKCITSDCIYDICEEENCDFGVTIQLEKKDSVFLYNIDLFDIKKEKLIFSHTYQHKGAINKYSQEVSYKISNDIIKTIFKKKQESITQKTEEEPNTIDSSKINTGIVSMPAIGLMGRFTFGQLNREQSRWGSTIWYVHPTTINSQIRIKAGIPLYGNDSVNRSINLKYPDIYASFEHEWGFQYFGIGIGLAMMHMSRFNDIVYEENYDSSQHIYIEKPKVIKYKEYYCANWVVNIRGGKPTGGFRGRISWPTPFNQDGTWIQNSFIEFSALGVFGNNNIKGGIGIAGMQKYRSSVDTIYDSYDFVNNHYTLNNSFVLAPCGKFAMLIGKQNVISLTFDLTGIFLPRVDNYSWWSPTLQIDYTFSFGPLKNPEVLDGTF